MMMNPNRLRSGRLTRGEPLMVPDTRPCLNRVEDLVEEALSEVGIEADGGRGADTFVSAALAEREARP